jgi:hypothetical protein
MSNVLGNLFGEIADAIRGKSGGTDTMKPAEFPAEIASIVTGNVEPVIEPLEITENGVYTADDIDGYSPVTVNVQSTGGGGSDELKYIEAQYAEVDLPNAKSIKSNAFYGDKVLTNISMPNVTSIGKGAFNNCPKLALTSLPSGLTSIEDSAFVGCTSLALTSLPSGITSMGQYTFSGCTSLALTSLPSGITSIGQYTFSGCKNLALTSLPSGITSIGQNAFYYCKNLTSITFEGKPTSIDRTAFSNCTNLTTINVPWAEGEVANAPWGATKATINYNYTGV